jgi:hypothetical protein
MSDVDIKIGTDGSTLTDSKVAIGNVAGGDIHVHRESRQRKNTTKDFDNRLSIIEEEFDQLMVEFQKVKTLLSGEWGMPGLVGTVGAIQKTMHDIEQKVNAIPEQLANIHRAVNENSREKNIWEKPFFVISVLCWLSAAFMTINGLWR